MNYHQQQSPYWSNPNSSHYGYPIIVTSSGTPTSPHFLPQNQYPQPPPQPQYLCAPVYCYPNTTYQQQPMMTPSSDTSYRRRSHRMSTISHSNSSNGDNSMRKLRRPMSVQAPTQQQYRMASIAEEKEVHQQQKRASSALCVTPSDKDEEVPLAMLAYRKGYPPYQRRSTTTSTTHHRHHPVAPCNYSAPQPSNMSIRSAPTATPRPQSHYRRSVRMETSHSASTRTTSNNSSRRPSLVSDHPYSNSTATSVTSSSEPSSSYSAAPATPSSVSRRPSVAKRWIHRFTRSLKS